MSLLVLLALFRVSKCPRSRASTYHRHVVGAHGDTGNAGPEEAKEDAVVQLRARKAHVHRAGVSLVDALAREDGVPVRWPMGPSVSIALKRRGNPAQVAFTVS